LKQVRSVSGGPLILIVLGDCVAENRGADFVQHLVPAPCARTRHWTGQQNPYNQAALACTAPAAGQRRDYGVEIGFFPDISRRHTI
jgi:hypothetical protein